MLGLRYFACRRCDTTFAEPAVAVPDSCVACGGDVRELTNRLCDASYFLASEE